MSDDILEYIKSKEGFHATAYKDNTQYSIGYGTRTEDPFEIEGISTVSKEEAHARLEEWTTKDRGTIKSLAGSRGLDLEEHEEDALVSFAYNLGPTNLSKLMQEGRSKEEIAAKMVEYNRSDGEVSQGLTMRRLEEANRFETPYIKAEVGEGKEGIVPEAVSGEPTGQRDLSAFDYQEPNIPSSALREKLPDPDEVKPTAGELYEAAKERHLLYNAIEKYSTINQESLQEDYEVSIDDLRKFDNQGYKDNELGFLAEATSPENFGARVARIDNDRKVAQLLEQGGGKGTLIEMGVGMADPLLLPTMFLGGVGAAAKFNSFKAIGASMLSGASQNLAVEFMLKAGDTQRTEEDLKLAAIFGAGFSGAITTAGLGFKAARSKVDIVNKVNASGRDDVQEFVEDSIRHDVDKKLSEEIPSAQERKVVMSEQEIVDKLKAERLESTKGATHESGKVKVVAPKKIKQREEEHAAYKKSQLDKIEKMKNSKIKPSAKVKQVAAMQEALDAKEVEIERFRVSNKILEQSNKDIDMLNKGQVPPSMKKRYDQIKEEAGEFEVKKPKIDPEKSVRKPEVDEEGVELPDNKSVGAMQAQGAIPDINTHDTLLTMGEVEEIDLALSDANDIGIAAPRVSRLASNAKGFKTMSTLIDEAPDDTTRGLGIQVLDNGTRTIEGVIPAEVLAETTFLRNVPDYLSHERAFAEYAAGKKAWFFSKKRQELRTEFDKLVVLEQAKKKMTTNKPAEGDSPVLKAAKARARIYQRSLELRKEYDVVGFSEVEHYDSYHSVVIDSRNIADIDAPDDIIKDTIAKAYQNGRVKLSRESAIKLATSQVDRAFKRTHDGDVFKPAISEADFARIDTELETLGVDVTTREELKSSLFSQDDAAHMSPRAMFSLGPDLTAASGKVRMVDIIDTSMTRVMKYASDSSADAGLASHGYKSRYQFMRALDAARTEAINELKSKYQSSDGAVKAEAKVQLDKAERGDNYELLEDGVKLMYREPLDGSSADWLSDSLKLTRKQIGITRLRFTGLMSIPEYAIAAARVGAASMIRNLPQSRFFDLREASIEKDDFMRQFSEIITGTGHQEQLFSAKFYNNSDFDDATKGKIMNTLNKVQGKAMSVTLTMNMFRSLQHGGEETVARSMIKNLQTMANKGEITPEIRASLIKTGGMTEAQVGEMVKHFKKNPDMDIFDSVKTMEPKLQNAMSSATRKTISNSFLRMGVGEMPPYVHTEMGKVMTSLLGFTIGSWEKQVVRGIKHDGAALLSAMAAGQIALATMAQHAYVYMRAQGKEGEERRKFIEDKLSDEGLFWGVLGRVGFMAAPMLPLQMLSAFGLMPESIQSSPTKAGINDAALPIVGMVKDLALATGSAADLVTSQITGDYMPDQEREANYRKLKRVMPWTESAVWNSTIGLID